MFKNVRIVLLLILVGTLLTGCFGIFGGDDNWTVSGVVVDQDENPIADASILVEYDSNSATEKTDNDGKWSFDVSGDSVTVSVAKDGYNFEPNKVTVKEADKEESVVFTGKGSGELIISPNAGEHVDSVTVSLVMVGNYTIYYTLDSSEPTAESTKYTEPFELTETTTVKAIAINNDDASDTSDVVEATYEIASLNYVKNHMFNEGLEHWVSNEIWGSEPAEISIDEEFFFTGSQSLFVSERTDTGTGPRQYIDGLEAGQTYEVSYTVFYKDGPDARGFFLSLKPDGDIVNLAGSWGGEGGAKKGEWTTISNTYTFADDINFGDNPYIFIETSWTEAQDTVNDHMDFWVDNVSITVAIPED